MTWHHLVTRKSYYFRNHLMFEAVMGLYPKVHGRKCTDILTYREGMQFIHYLDSESEKAMNIHFLENCAKSHKYYKFFLDNATDVGNKIVCFNKKLYNNTEFAKLSNKRLAKLLVTYSKTYMALYPYFHPTVNTAMSDDNIKAYIKSENSDDILVALITPSIPTIQRQEEIELMKLGIKISKMVDKHAKKFFWLPTTDESEPWDKHYFMKKLGLNEINHDTKLKELEKNHKELMLRRRILEKMLPKKVKAYTDLIRTFTWLRMYCRNIFCFAHIHSKPLFDEIARRAGYSYDDIKFFNYKELVDFLLNRIRLNSLTVKDRKEACLFILKDGKLVFFQGNVAKETYKNIIPEVKIETVSTIKGVSANKGYAKGKVKIVITTKDAKAIKPGEILVARNTNPHFIEGMHRAVAIVTDEGGITCHAAIVSRELGVPCITSTKIATKIFKDGDLIEVDAIKGIINRLVS